jgi:hypothetical protein
MIEDEEYKPSFLETKYLEMAYFLLLLSEAWTNEFGKTPSK